MSEVSNNNNGGVQEVDIIRKMWELPSSHYYLTFFKEPLGLTKNLTIEELEDSIVTPTGLHYTLISDLFCHLLRACQKKTSPTNWESILKKEIEKKTNPLFLELFPRDNPFIDEEFAHVDIPSRIQLLKACCDWNLQKSQKVMEYVASYVTQGYTDSLRMVPIGKIEKEQYWYFGDCRLYKETLPPPPTPSRGRKSVEPPLKSKWEMTCNSQEEWNALVERLESSEVDEEQELHSALSELLPEVTTKITARKRKNTIKNRTRQQQLWTHTKLITRNGDSDSPVDMEFGGMRLRPRPALRFNLFSGNRNDESDEEEEEDDDDEEEDQQERPIKTRRTDRSTSSAIPAFTSSGRRISKRVVDEYGLPMFQQNQNNNVNNNFDNLNNNNFNNHQNGKNHEKETENGKEEENNEPILNYQPTDEEDQVNSMKIDAEKE